MKLKAKLLTGLFFGGIGLLVWANSSYGPHAESDLLRDCPGGELHGLDSAGNWAVTCLPAPTDTVAISPTLNYGSCTANSNIEGNRMSNAGGLVSVEQSRPKVVRWVWNRPADIDVTYDGRGPACDVQAYIYGKRVYPNHTGSSFNNTDPGPKSGDCSQEMAEGTLLGVARSQTVPQAQFSRNTNWQRAGPCSWTVTGLIGWRDAQSNEPVMETFNAAVHRGDDGNYVVYMFNITGSR